MEIRRQLGKMSRGSRRQWHGVYFPYAAWNDTVIGERGLRFRGERHVYLLLGLFSKKMRISATGRWLAVGQSLKAVRLRHLSVLRPLGLSVRFGI